MHKNNKIMKNINIGPKINFNLENEREKYLKILGESPIFFGSILNLIWIIENNTSKMKIQKIKNTWTTWSPSLIEVENQVARSALSTIDLSQRVATLVIKTNAQD